MLKVVIAVTVFVASLELISGFCKGIVTEKISVTSFFEELTAVISDFIHKREKKD